MSDGLLRSLKGGRLILGGFLLLLFVFRSPVAAALPLVLAGVSIVFTLARETGWPESFLVWRLPLPRALQYYHCALRASLAWTVPPSEPATNRLARLEALAASLAVDEDDEA